MTDLFTRPMPAELAGELMAWRLELRRTADEIDTFLERFLEESWADCQREFECDSFRIEKDGTRVDFKVMVRGSPDFNEFDRVTHRYEKAARKLRAELWGIYHAADDLFPPED